MVLRIFKNKRIFGRTDVSGFTLIEIAIVIIISGLLLSFFSAGLNIYFKQRALSTTAENLRNAEQSLKTFLEVNGYYPCPANRASKKGEATFGKAAPLCMIDSKQVTTSSNRADNPSVVGRDGIYVRVGLLPFRSLGLSDSEAVDGWGHILQYAVTEVLTDREIFNPLSGSIDVVAEDRQSRLTPPGTAQYVIFSTGEDGMGGYSDNGIPTGKCQPDLLQSENCDDDAIFMDAQRQYETTEKGKVRTSVISYDDNIVYQQYDPSFQTQGGLLYYYKGSCVSGFKQVDLKDYNLAGIERLSKLKNTGADSNDNGAEVLCYSSRYSASMTMMGDTDINDPWCPNGWDPIGYFGYETSANASAAYYLVCAR